MRPDAPEPVPEPPTSFKDAALGALTRAVGTQPVMLGFLAVTLSVLYVAWQIGVEVRKVEHLEARMMLERCLPARDAAPR